MKNKAYYIVKTTVDKSCEKEFNEWYHNVHIPDVVKASGCIQARRLKAIEKDDEYEYLAIYEFDALETFNAYKESAERKALIQDFLDKYERVTKMKSSIWEQVYP